MKRTYQIEERKAIQRFRSHLTKDPGTIQLILPLAELAERMRRGVDQMLFDAEVELLQLIMQDEVGWLTGHATNVRIVIALNDGERRGDR